MSEFFDQREGLPRHPLATDCLSSCPRFFSAFSIVASPAEFSARADFLRTLETHEAQLLTPQLLTCSKPSSIRKRRKCSMPGIRRALATSLRIFISTLASSPPVLKG